MCAVHQPQYLPWLGFFSKLDAADVFILYDDAQYKHDEWQNRNRIKTADGAQWLTVPVHHSQGELIREVRIDRSKRWARKHVNALAANYARTPFYPQYAPALRQILDAEWERLAELNVAFIRDLCRALGITTPLLLSSELDYDGRATDALVSMCRAVGADRYLSGAGAGAYLEPEKFEPAGIELLHHDFVCPAYPQQFGPFVPSLSAVDLLLNCGDESLEVVRSGRRIAAFPRTPQARITQ